MNVLGPAFERLASALLIAASVALLTVGLFAYAPAGGMTIDPGTPEPSEVAGDPILGTPSPVSSTPDAQATPRTAAPATPVPSPAPTGARPTESPAPSTGSPAPPVPTADGGAVASRIRIPSLRIDLAIMSGEAEVRGNRDGYPLCDVAQYLTYFANPGQPGASYIYAHAQRGMFLPLLRASQRNDGAEMIGALVELYTADNMLHLYEIYRVKRHARDLSLATDVPVGEHILVLQTSEGTTGHIPKLQVAARPLTVLPADPDEANPKPDPRPCPPRR